MRQKAMIFSVRAKASSGAGSRPDAAGRRDGEAGARQGRVLGAPCAAGVGGGGGCSGFSYQLDFDEHVREGDRVLEYDGVRVLVDPTSAEYLAGTEIDFVSSLHGGGFRFSNPKATHTCGCGSSFAV